VRGEAVWEREPTSRVVKERELAPALAAEGAAGDDDGCGQGKKLKGEGTELSSLPFWASGGRRESA
jgi:hypothetical protein